MNKCLLHSTKALNFLRTHLLSLLLLLFYLTEGYSKLTVLTFGERPIIARAFKAIVLLVILLGLMKAKKNFILILLISLCFILGQLFINPNFDFIVLLVFIKYLFPIMLFTYFNQKRPDETTLMNLRKIFEALILFNSILIFIGFIFHIDLFETYRGSRFGYNGLLVSSAVSTYIYIITLFYFLLKYKSEFIYKKKVIFIILSCLLVGTKSLYLGVIAVLLFYLYRTTNKKQKYISIFSIVLLAFSGGYYALFISGMFNEIRISRGILTAILSHRNEIFTQEMLPFIKDNWTIVNYFFGGINNISTRPQMAFLDLFYFFGATGSIIYIYSYTSSYFKFKIKGVSLFFILILGLVVSFSGNFFLNASVVIYMLVIKETIILENRSESGDF